MFDHSSKAATAFYQVLLTVFGLIFAFPVCVMLKVSLGGEGLGNYLAVVKLEQFPRYFLNSAIVSAGTIVVVFVCVLLGAYAFSKLQFRFKNGWFNLILIGLMIPSVSLVVPLFITVKNLQLFDTYLAVIGPISALALPFNLLLMKNFFDEVPNGLLEAARIDGCNSFSALARIMLPMSKPIAIVVVIWTFLSSWNEYFLGLVFMRSDKMQLVTQAPKFFVDTYSSDIHKVFAALVLISLPVLIAYILLQKYFEDGMTSGSIK